MSIRYYAMCTACENPVVLVGLYKKTDPYKKEAHGRHRSKSLNGFPCYNQQAYDLCPLASKNRAFERDGRKPPKFDKLASEISKMLTEQFDRVVYLLQRNTDIKLGKNTLKNMLAEYLSSRGNYYMGATLENTPWIFAYMTANHKLYGQSVKKDSPLANAIKKNCPEAALEDISNNYIRISAKKGKFLDLTFAFVGHRQVRRKGETVELMQLMVWRKKDEIYKKEIVFDTDYWFSLVNFNDGNRQYDLVELARESLHHG